MRLSVVGMFCCWIALSVVGAGFQKETEEAAFGAAGERHPVLAIAHGAVIGGAVLGALAIAIGGLPLVWEAIGDARARRDGRLVSLLALPAVAVGCFAALTLLLLVLGPSSAGGRTNSAPLGIFIPWLLGGIASAATCALAPRLVLGRAAVSRDSLRRASLASMALWLAMGVISISLVVYEVALAWLAPELAAQSGGPLGPSTGVMLVASAAVAVASSRMQPSSVAVETQVLRIVRCTLHSDRTRRTRRPPFSCNPRDGRIERFAGSGHGRRIESALEQAPRRPLWGVSRLWRRPFKRCPISDRSVRKSDNLASMSRSASGTGTVRSLCL